jgi:hypothetical protein
MFQIRILSRQPDAIYQSQDSLYSFVDPFWYIQNAKAVFHDSHIQKAAGRLQAGAASPRHFSKHLKGQAGESTFAM